MIEHPFSVWHIGRNKTGILGLMPLMKGERRVLALTILSGILAQGGTLASLAIGAWLVGKAVTTATPQELYPSILLFGAIVIISASARWWQAHVSHTLAFALIETLQIGIYDGLERAAPAAILGRRTGELASIATGDAELMEHFYAHTLADYIGAILVPLVAVIALYAIHPVTAIALLPFLILVASVPYWLARQAEKQGNEVIAELGRLNAEAAEVIQGQRELAVFGRARDFLDRLIGQVKSVSSAQRRYGMRAGLEHAAIDVLTALAVLTATLVGLKLVSDGQIDRSVFPLVVVLAGGALAPIAEVTQTARRFGELRAGATRILAIFHQRPQVDDRGRHPIPNHMTIRFEGVGFGYGGGRSSVLSGVDFTVQPGELVALVGRSGEGKSTIANLLLRFWDVDTGRISIGGCDIRDLPIEELRRLVSYVPQDIHVFNETIADNIRLGRPDAPMEAVENAARLALAHDFITVLPDGYDTGCGEHGTRLSGGQRQRLAIARALLTQAPILLLDEASSNLDMENERGFQMALDHIRRGRTVLVIAHRLATIANADRILVVENGRIIEQGSHAELLAHEGGRYRQLHATQGSGRFDVATDRKSSGSPLAGE